MSRQKKRFIAGATCPSCQAMDTIELYLENNVETIHCVQCHYKKQQPDDATQAATRQFEQVIGIFKPDA
ncbi:YheV family putative zinc ribbon protein [Algicola sagamiensis]|uniref:YheV family putative zinc ribbon protein n=1 Tax=Algicola sagamiensis TaxID=163869 RepID=UPI00037AAF1F|nr:YheV family putative zinc ribbon protein [Algicola sagamiensis]